MTRKILVILSVILLLSSVLRLYSLGNVKLGFFRDEAALGFNSWSILKSGADEYGQRFPIIFRSFEVFFMPAYVYLSVPFFIIFGQSELSARLLSAISGIAITLLVFLIGRKLFKSQTVGLIAGFVVATSPWAVFYSRGAFEGNLSLMFFLVGVYFWLLFLKKRSLYFFLSIFAFVLSMYSYQAPRFVVPLFIALSIIIQQGWYKKWKLCIAGAIFAFILYFPIVKLTLSPASYHRAAGVSIFSNKNFSGGVIQELLSLYSSYYSPYNLFWNGDYNLQRNVPNYSVFYIFQLPFFVIGLWYFVKNKTKYKKLLLIWFLISPIPAALTPDPFHTYRSILFWVPVSLIVSYGVYISYLKFKNIKYIFFVGYTCLTLLFVFGFMFSLFNIAPVLYSRQWDYGYKEISDYIKNQPDTWRVVIDDPLTEVYIHLLFYNNIDMASYQKEAYIGDKYYNDSSELRPTKVGRFESRPVDWPTERGDKNTIFIFPSYRLPPSEFSGDPKLKLDKTIIAPDGKDAFYIIKTQV